MHNIGKIILRLLIISLLMIGNHVFAYSVSTGDNVIMLTESGVKVRNSPTTTDKPEIGAVPQYETGTVLNNPEQTTEKYVWRKIRWNYKNITGWTPNRISGDQWYKTQPVSTSPGELEKDSEQDYEVISNINPTLSWKKTNSAVNYKIVLIKIDSSDTIFDKEIDGNSTSYQVNEDLTEGRYIWNLAPKDENGGLGIYSKARYFQITEEQDADAPDLTIRSNDIEIRSQSGSDNVIHQDEEFDIKLKAYNQGQIDSGRYSVRFSYGGISNLESDFDRFDGESDNDVGVGEKGKVLYSKDKKTDDIAGTHYIQVCIYNKQDDDDPDNNDCTVKAFTVASNTDEPTPVNPAISSVNPNPAPSSSNYQTIVINGSNFESGAKIHLTWLEGSKTLSSSKVTYVGSTQINISIVTGAQNDTWTVQVENTDGAKSSAYTFTSALTESPFISSISPNTIDSSVYEQSVVVSGEGFNNASKVFWSSKKNGVNYSEVLNITGDAPYTQITANQIKLNAILFSTSDDIYFKVINGDLESNVEKINANFSNTKRPPRLVEVTDDINNNVEKIVINSGERVSLQYAVIDIDNLFDEGELFIDWDDDSKSTVPLTLENGLITASVSHTYNSTNDDDSKTIKAKAVDADGNTSNTLPKKVYIFGSSGRSGGSSDDPVVNNEKNDKVSKSKISDDMCRSKENSVDTATGAEHFSIDLLKTTGLVSLPFSLSYNSLLITNGNISNGWSHNFNLTSKLDIIDSNKIRVYWDSASKKYNDFNKTNDLYKSSDKGFTEYELVKKNDLFILTNKNQTRFYYNNANRLSKIENYKNNQINITFDGAKIKKVTEPVSGVYLEYFYNEQDKLSKVEDNGGREILLAYDDGNLSNIKAQEGIEYDFNYNSLGQITQHLINGNQYFKLTYENGRVKTEDDGKSSTPLVGYIFDDSQPSIIKGKYTNKLGFETNYIYDDNNFNLHSVKNADNSTTVNEYYTSGVNTAKLKKSTNDKNHSTNYEYDSNGNTSKTTYHDGSKVEYEYDNNRNTTKIQITGKSGSTFITNNIYDANNNLTTSTNANSDATTYKYNSNNQVIEETSPERKTTQYEYTKGRLTKIIDDDNNQIGYGYDDLGRKISETDVFGNTTLYRYDGADRLKEIQDPSGDIVKHTYDYRNNRISTTDKNGNRTIFYYDENNNLIEKTGVAYAKDSYTNHAYEYDENDNLIKYGLISKNLVGNIISSVDKATYSYDALGRLTTEVDADGNSITTNYDTLGNVASIQDAYGNTIVTNTYDSIGNLITSKNALNHTTTNEYDALGNIIQTEDPSGRVTIYTYDKLGGLTIVTNANNKQSRQIFDKDGNRTKLIDENDNETIFTYDDIGNILTQTTASGSRITNAYIKGRLDKRTNGRGKTTEYGYDANGRISQTKDYDGTINYGYDKNGNVLTVTTQGGSSYVAFNNYYRNAGATSGGLWGNNGGCPGDGAITRIYDKLNRVISYTYDGGCHFIKYTYDAAGNLKTLTYPDDKKVEYKYDNNNRLTQTKDWNNKITIYGYDKNGRLIKTTRPNGTMLTRSYNNAGQLIEQKDITPSGGIIAQYNYEYDAVGNIIKEDVSPSIKTKQEFDVTMQYHDGNQLDKINDKSPLFDLDENMLTLPSGNNNMSMVYDSRNRLVQAGDVYSMYDAENHRTTKIDKRTGVQTDYIINPESPLSQVLVSKAQTYTYYVYGQGLESQQINGQTLYYHYDLRGSSVALTNETGEIVDRFEYLPYGKLASHSVGSTQTPFLYNGRDGVMNDNNGLYYMRARFYSTEARRFVNRDVLLGDMRMANALNQFAFVNGRPIIGVDPKGEFIQCALGAPIGFLGDLASQLIINTLTNKDLFDIDGTELLISTALGCVSGGVAVAGKLGKVAGKVLDKKIFKKSIGKYAIKASDFLGFTNVNNIRKVNSLEGSIRVQSKLTRNQLYPGQFITHNGKSIGANSQRAIKRQLNKNKSNRSGILRSALLPGAPAIAFNLFKEAQCAE